MPNPVLIRATDSYPENRAQPTKISVLFASSRISGRKRDNLHASLGFGQVQVQNPVFGDCAGNLTNSRCPLRHFRLGLYF